MQTDIALTGLKKLVDQIILETLPHSGPLPGLHNPTGWHRKLTWIIGHDGWYAQTVRDGITVILALQKPDLRKLTAVQKIEAAKYAAWEQETYGVDVKPDVTYHQIGRERYAFKSLTLTVGHVSNVLSVGGYTEFQLYQVVEQGTRAERHTRLCAETWAVDVPPTVIYPILVPLIKAVLTTGLKVKALQDQIVNGAWPDARYGSQGIR